MDKPRTSKAVARTLDTLQRQLDGCRKALAPYQGQHEDDLTPWDKGMIRHYEALRLRLLKQIEELESGDSGAA